MPKLSWFGELKSEKLALLYYCNSYLYLIDVSKSVAYADLTLLIFQALVFLH